MNQRLSQSHVQVQYFVTKMALSIAKFMNAKQVYSRVNVTNTTATMYASMEITICKISHQRLRLCWWP